jgi:hypothetical protein
MECLCAFCLADGSCQCEFVVVSYSISTCISVPSSCISMCICVPFICVDAHGYPMVSPVKLLIQHFHVYLRSVHVSQPGVVWLPQHFHVY